MAGDVIDVSLQEIEENKDVGRLNFGEKVCFWIGWGKLDPWFNKPIRIRVNSEEFTMRVLKAGRKRVPGLTGTFYAERDGNVGKTTDADAAALFIALKKLTGE